jgi:hypothetical protein
VFVDLLQNISTIVLQEKIPVAENFTSLVFRLASHLGFFEKLV